MTDPANNVGTYPQSVGPLARVYADAGIMAPLTFGTNSGTGGDFTVTGMLDDVTPPP